MLGVLCESNPQVYPIPQMLRQGRRRCFFFLVRMHCVCETITHDICYIFMFSEHIWKLSHTKCEDECAAYMPTYHYNHECRKCEKKSCMTDALQHPTISKRWKSVWKLQIRRYILCLLTYNGSSFFGNRKISFWQQTFSFRQQIIFFRINFSYNLQQIQMNKY